MDTTSQSCSMSSSDYSFHEYELCFEEDDWFIDQCAVATDDTDGEQQQESHSASAQSDVVIKFHTAASRYQRGHGESQAS